MAVDLAEFAARHLAPPSPAQQAEIDLQQQAQAAQLTQLAQRSFEQMQKRVALSRMTAEAQIETQAGADPLQARYNAFTKYGSQLVQDPVQYESLISGMETKLDASRRQKAFKARTDELMSQKDEEGNPMPLEKAMTRAYMENYSGAQGSGLGTILGHQITAESSLNRDVMRKQIASMIEEGKSARQDKAIAAKAENVDVTESGKNARAAASVASREKISSARLEEIKARDATLQKHYENLDARVKATALPPVTKGKLAALQSGLSDNEKKLGTARTEERWDDVKKLLDRKKELTSEMENLLPDQSKTPSKIGRFTVTPE